MAKLIVIGGGEHGRVVVEAARDAGLELLGFVDPAPCDELVRRFGLARLGDDTVLTAHGTALVVLGVGAVGRSRTRADLVARVAIEPARWARVVHGQGWVSPSATLGEGTVVMAGAHVQTGARIGAHCVINTGAIVEHDVEVGDFTQIGPGARVGGGTSIGRESYVGLGASIRDHLRLGSNVLVGMGAVVVKDAPDGAELRGVPAR